MLTMFQRHQRNTRQDTQPAEVESTDVRDHWPPRRGGVWPSCAGPCSGGDKLCPTPTECQLPEGEDPLSAARGVLLCVVGAIAAYAAGVAFWLALK